MGRVRDCLGHRLEHEEESEDVLVIRCIRCIHLILAFQTWVKNRYSTCRRYNFFFLWRVLMSLQGAGMTVFIPDLLEKMVQISRICKEDSFPCRNFVSSHMA